MTGVQAYDQGSGWQIMPFGGRKGSSYGAREQGRAAVDCYTSIKTAYTLA